MAGRVDGNIVQQMGVGVDAVVSVQTSLDIGVQRSLFERVGHVARVLAGHSRVDRHLALRLRLAALVLLDRRDVPRHALQQRRVVVAVQPVQRLRRRQLGERPRGLVAVGENGVRAVLRTLRFAPAAIATSSNSSSTISLTMCRIECMGSDMIFTLAVTERPVVPTNSSTSSTVHAALLSHSARAAFRASPPCAAAPTPHSALARLQRPRRPQRTAFGR